jgi:cellulose synthase/poly-beta-1,6-N-acetylglucosamine synthase-like glycosyltransferase
MSLILIIIYGCCLFFIFLYSLVQLSLVWTYRRGRGEEAFTGSMHSVFGEQKDWPVVTIQLPVYNERYVVNRLIDSVCAIRYPKDKLHIQVLDDSTDDSFELAAKSVKHWQEKGIDIVHVKRPERTGFKAGALAYGLTCSKGDFTAIFDADFMPYPDFLERCIPYSSDPLGTSE